MTVELWIEQEAIELDAERLRAEIGRLAERAGYAGDLSVAVVTDAAIHELNRTYLSHDYPTDVLAFPLEEDEGEIVVSAERARSEAERRGVSPEAELMLYVVHGLLHLTGHDDHDPAAARRMDAATLKLLRGLGYRNKIDRRE